MSVRFMQDQALRAARDGRSVRKVQDAQTVTAAFVVQTSADIYYNIPEGKQIVVARMKVACETVEEYVAGYLVSCAEVTAGGVATKVSGELHDHVGSKKEGSGHIVRDTLPPIVIKYSSGARSVSMAIKATDAATVVGYGYTGWIEDESTLS